MSRNKNQVDKNIPIKKIGILGGGNTRDLMSVLMSMGALNKCGYELVKVNSEIEKSIIDSEKILANTNHNSFAELKMPKLFWSPPETRQERRAKARKKLKK